MSTYKARSSRYSVYNSAKRNNRGRYSNKNSKKGRNSQYIDPSRFIRVAKEVEEVEYQAQHTFADFDVDPLIHKNLENKGFVTPSPIQDQAIPPALEGRDVIGIANTGTGKTAAFAIPVLNRIMREKSARVLIVAPTRELAQQIEAEFKEIAKNSGLFGALLIGGSNMGLQLRDLRDKPPVIIGTPGRIKDHLQRGTLKLSQFNMVVLDEVDRMLDMGFVDEVTEILAHVSSERQSFFFSATMDQRVRKLIEVFSRDPVTVSVKSSDTSESVHQDVVRYKSRYEKIDMLHEILIRAEVEKVIVFNETQRDVEQLNTELIDRGFLADAIHGGKSQGQRQRALRKFKKSEIDILVATDVAARGIDVADITHVINYSTPQTYDDYVHRIGRAGRAGRIGYALTFVNH